MIDFERASVISGGAKCMDVRLLASGKMTGSKDTKFIAAVSGVKKRASIKKEIEMVFEVFANRIDSVQLVQ